MAASSSPKIVPVRSAEQTYTAAGCVRALCQFLVALSALGILGGLLIGFSSGGWLIAFSVMASSAAAMVVFLALERILTLLFALHDKVQALSTQSAPRPPPPPRPPA